MTRGRVLNGDLYAQRLQKLIYLHLSRLFHENFSPNLGPVDWIEIFMKQPVDKCTYINFCNFYVFYSYVTSWSIPFLFNSKYVLQICTNTTLTACV